MPDENPPERSGAMRRHYADGYRAGVRDALLTAADEWERDGLFDPDGDSTPAWLRRRAGVSHE